MKNAFKFFSFQFIALVITQSALADHEAERMGKCLADAALDKVAMGGPTRIPSAEDTANLATKCYNEAWGIREIDIAEAKKVVSPPDHRNFTQTEEQWLRSIKVDCIQREVVKGESHPKADQICEAYATGFRAQVQMQIYAEEKARDDVILNEMRELSREATLNLAH